MIQEILLRHLGQQQESALQMEQIVDQRIQEGVDKPLARNQAKLITARVRLRMTEAQGAIAVLRNRLSHLTGLPAHSIETVPESMPPLPEVKQEDDFPGKSGADQPGSAGRRDPRHGPGLRARGEHRAMWPSVDFATQYAMLFRYNNYTCSSRLSSATTPRSESRF